MGALAGFLNLLTILGSLAGAAVLLLTFASARGAPQEAAGAALALSLAVIPYVIARTVQGIADSSRRNREAKELLRTQLDIVQALDSMRDLSRSDSVKT